MNLPSLYIYHIPFCPVLKSPMISRYLTNPHSTYVVPNSLATNQHIIQCRNPMCVKALTYPYLSIHPSPIPYRSVKFKTKTERILSVSPDVPRQADSDHLITLVGTDTSPSLPLSLPPPPFLSSFFLKSPLPSLLTYFILPHLTQLTYPAYLTLPYLTLSYPFLSYPI